MKSGEKSLAHLYFVLRISVEERSRLEKDLTRSKNECRDLVEEILSHADFKGRRTPTGNAQ